MNDIRTGDCLAGMAAMQAESVDAVVTDPPYELAFMGRKWDSTGISFRPETWAAALRVAKPGAHLVAFGGTRTWHRIAVAIEDGGWEIRDTLCWLHGQGFPKSLDVSKAIDRAAGDARPALGGKIGNSCDGNPCRCTTDNGRFGKTVHSPATSAASAASAAWDGWGTALKPAFEPIILARKRPTGTVAANVLEHGTGALNIDGCRIEALPGDEPMTAEHVAGNRSRENYRTGVPVNARPSHVGRWPANVVLDEDAAAMLDEQSGDRQSGDRQGGEFGMMGFGGNGVKPMPAVFGDSGGASRFFYTAKASRSDRGAENKHPTVKPTALMRWLVKLVTPPGGLVLDPFLGSGTTALACFLEGFSCIGFEQDEVNAQTARNRIRDEAPLYYEATA